MLRRAMRRIRSAIVMAGAAMALIATPPALAQGGGAETFTESQTLEFDSAIDDPCNGGALAIAGQIHVLAHETVDPTGGVHLVTKSSLSNVTGTSESGTTYRFQLVTVQPFNDPSGRGASGQQPGLEFSQVQAQRTITQGSADNLLVTLVSHVTINADGEPTAVVEHVDARCVG